MFSPEFIEHHRFNKLAKLNPFKNIKYNLKKGWKLFIYSFKISSNSKNAIRSTNHYCIPELLSECIPTTSEVIRLSEIFLPFYWLPYFRSTCTRWKRYCRSWSLTWENNFNRDSILKLYNLKNKLTSIPKNCGGQKKTENWSPKKEIHRITSETQIEKSDTSILVSLDSFFFQINLILKKTTNLLGSEIYNFWFWFELSEEFSISGIEFWCFSR